MFGAVFAALWAAVVLVRSVVAVVLRAGVMVVQVLCGVLDWVGAEY